MACRCGDSGCALGPVATVTFKCIRDLIDEANDLETMWGENEHRAIQVAQKLAAYIDERL